MLYSFILKICFLLHPCPRNSQYPFVFESIDPKSMTPREYIWTVLLQVFRASPCLFVRASEKDVRELQLQETVILYYINDILVCIPLKKASDCNTIQDLNFLGHQGYRVSKKKAQITRHSKLFRMYPNPRI